MTHRKKIKNIEENLRYFHDKVDGKVLRSIHCEDGAVEIDHYTDNSLENKENKIMIGFQLTHYLYHSGPFKQNISFDIKKDFAEVSKYIAEHTMEKEIEGEIYVKQSNQPSMRKIFSTTFDGKDISSYDFSPKNKDINITGKYLGRLEKLTENSDVKEFIDLAVDMLNDR